VSFGKAIPMIKFILSTFIVLVQYSKICSTIR